MISSGTKRGLAYSAITALAVTGLPAMAGTASAEPLSSQADSVTAVDLHAPDGTASIKNDGVNQTVHLLANAGADVIQVRFEYNNGTDWVTIATVSRENGAFSTEWTPPAARYNLATDVRAVALGATNTEIGTPDTESVTVDPGAESIDIANAAGSAVGVFDQPYDDADTNSDVAGDQAATWLGAVSGTTSDLSNNPDISVTSPSGTGGAFDEDYREAVAAGDTVRDWSAKVDFKDYDWGTATDADQAIVVAELAAGGDDAEAVSVYQQTITTVTATAANPTVQGSGTTSATVTVLDQNGKPVAGAQVVSEDTSPAVTSYTNSRGQATFTGLTGSAAGNTYDFYVNTTDDNAYENGIDFKRSVTVTSYSAAATTLAATSEDGSAFDRNENDANDIQVVVKDQNGNPIENQTVSYYWSIDPFNAATADSRVPATGADTTATTDADGKANIVLPAGPSGAYTLNYYVNQDGTPGQQAGDLAGAPLTVKVGQADVKWADGSVAQAKEGSTETFEGKLVLEDGTALAGRDVAIQWLRSGTGNSVVAAQAAQPAGTTRTGDFTATTKTGADGTFAVALTDPAPPADTDPADELNGVLRATVASVADSSDLEVDWLESVGPVDADDITISTQNLIDAMRTPGRPVDLDIDVENADGTLLTDYPVTVSLDRGFLSPNAENAGDLEADPEAADGGLYGEWASLGQSQELSTDDSGEAGIVVGIERDELFDTQTTVPVTVTIKAGDVTKTQVVQFTSDAPLNGGEDALSIELADEQTVGVLPKAPTSESVYYDVFVTDQFGNLVAGETVDLTDNLAGAFMDTNWDSGDNNVEARSQLKSDGPALELESNVEGNQVVQGTWTAPVNIWEDGNIVTPGFQAVRDNNSTPAETSKEFTDTAAAVEWYDIDVAASTYTMTSDADGVEPVGSTVIVTYKAVDQNGEPIQGLDVQFFRTGPDDEQDGDGNDWWDTDENGVARYVFQGAAEGTAKIEAIARTSWDETNNTLIPESRATTSVTFGAEKVEKISLNPRLVGKNNGARNDKLKVKTGNPAGHNVRVKLFRIKKGNRIFVESGQLGPNGNKTFRVKDRNGRKFTKYVAKVIRTDNTRNQWTKKKRVR